MEGENPTRRYKWFRPRQAANGYAPLVAPTNYGTAGLFNNSTGAQYLAVRAFHCGGSTGAQLWSWLPGLPSGATVQTTSQPALANVARLPGQIWTLDAATLLGDPFADYSADTDFGWRHDFPFVIIPPNYSLVYQQQATGNMVTFTITWEAIEADELDFWN
jgi:hypothetical protein